MTTTARAWGNSLAMRLPKSLTEALGISDGTELEVTQEGDRFIVAPVAAATKKPVYALDDLLKEIQPGSMHSPSEIGWDFSPIGEEAL